MVAALKEIEAYCAEQLQVSKFSDYCPNGLQVEGRSEVGRIAAAVTANQSVLDAATAWGADLLLVHHGYFWRGEAQPLVGMKRRRIDTLLKAEMSLLAYHLPLDAHLELGNNAQWGRRLGVLGLEPLHPGNDSAVGNLGSLPTPQTLAALVSQVEALTCRKPLLIGEPEREVQRVAWCTGAAQGYIEVAAEAGADIYISGEISEPTVHAARELGIAYLAAGHHATERYGVQALGARLAEHFDLEWTFLDCDNPV